MHAQKMCHLEIETADSVALIRFDGMLDASTVPQMRPLIDDVLTKGCHYVVDLNKVSFLDSTGVGLLASIVKYARNDTGKVVFAGGNEQVRSILTMVGFDDLAIICDDSKSAMQSFLNTS